jgi:coenzyme F420 hydrogenase subunit beta
MQLDADGFLRPRQHRPLPDQTERAIERSCPGLGVAQTPAAGARDDALWGPYLNVRTGFARDPDLRHRASSGGALSALLVHLLKAGEVERIVQVAADPARPEANRTVTSSRLPEVFAAAGSRYAPSAPLSDIDRELDRPGRFAFVGKPCDVAALRALAQSDPRVDRKVAYMISFFCAGVPSLRGVGEVLEGLGVQPGALAAFRYRGHGWPGSATAVLRDGRTARMSYAQSWGGILSRHVQFRCKICADGVGGAADVVCADAWHCDARGYPLFEEADGHSLVLTRTARGEALVQRAAAAGTITLRAQSADAIAPMQPGQANRKALVLSRLLAVRLLAAPVPRYLGLRLARAAWARGPWAQARSFVGTLRRAWRQRRARDPNAGSPPDAITPALKRDR